MKQKMTYHSRSSRPLGTMMVGELIAGLVFLPLTIMGVLFGGLFGASRYRANRRRPTKFARRNYLKNKRR